LIGTFSLPVAWLPLVMYTLSQFPLFRVPSVVGGVWFPYRPCPRLASPLFKPLCFCSLWQVQSFFTCYVLLDAAACRIPALTCLGDDIFFLATLTPNSAFGPFYVCSVLCTFVFPAPLHFSQTFGTLPLFEPTKAQLKNSSPITVPLSSGIPLDDWKAALRTLRAPPNVLLPAVWRCSVSTFTHLFFSFVSCPVFFLVHAIPSNATLFLHSPLPAWPFQHSRCSLGAFLFSQDSVSFLSFWATLPPTPSFLQGALSLRTYSCFSSV